MTTKQTPAQKHVALAKKTIEYWQDTHAFRIPADIKHDMILDFSEALSQVETEALASKVVFPTDEEIAIAKDKFHKDHRKEMGIAPFCDEVEKWIVRFIRSQLTLTPNEPEVKAQGFDEWE